MINETNLTSRQHSPAGKALSGIFLSDLLKCLIWNKEYSARMYEGMRHYLYLYLSNEDLRAFIELVEEDLLLRNYGLYQAGILELRKKAGLTPESSPLSKDLFEPKRLPEGDSETIILTNGDGPSVHHASLRCPYFRANNKPGRKIGRGTLKEANPDLVCQLCKTKLVMEKFQS